MSDIAIRADRLGKVYRLGKRQRYRSLRDTIMESLTAPFRRARALAASGAGGDKSFWALRDISFDISRGEVVGVIGGNGAGKSTLLKILARITEPTAGCLELHGRVGSLLEVGTGFHPELTGRENVYLNGAILGMRRAEINRKFDEIVAFAEIEEFLDTPVKHFSSGMYMRLAFAVAAHLEPEVLLVDEVLAVGDFGFQKKCLGRMATIASEGRTVLFVSHNMQAIEQLTHRCLVFARGGLAFDGPTAQAVNLYTTAPSSAGVVPGLYQAAKHKRGNFVKAARVQTSEQGGIHCWGQPITFEFELDIAEPRVGLCFSFQIVNRLQQPICHFWMFEPDTPFRRQVGVFLLRLEVPKLRLYQGNYTLTTWLSDRRANAVMEHLDGISGFEVTMRNVRRAEYDWAPDGCMYLEAATWAPICQVAGSEDQNGVPMKALRG